MRYTGSNMKDVILTGLRANNDLTIGNYFGAILPMVDMAKTRSHEYQLNMFIPDLHSFTTPVDHAELPEQIMNNARLFVAAGLPLDNPSIYLYRQSYIPAHSELMWILSCFTGFGEMNRMTQFKEKSKSLDRQAIKSELMRLRANETAFESALEETLIAMDLAVRSGTTVGLFNYPILMAADILLYGTRYVPVGDDQTQHVEFARDIALRMNHKFGELFRVPEPVKTQHAFFGKDQGLRIMDLQNPTKKMSKSDEIGKGVIFLGDDPAEAAKKVMSATTDDKAEINFDRANQPGISNLLEILALLRAQPLKQTTAEFQGQTRYGDFKQVVAQAVETFLRDFQTRLQTTDNTAILTKLEQSERDLAATANATLRRTQQAVGLRPKD